MRRQETSIPTNCVNMSARTSRYDPREPNMVLRQDRETVRLIALTSCEIGTAMCLVIDLNACDVFVTTRITTPVVIIAKIEKAVRSWDQVGILTDAKNSRTGRRNSISTPPSSTSVMGDDDGAALSEIAASSDLSSDFAWSTYGKHGKASDWNDMRAVIDRVQSRTRLTSLVVSRADNRKIFAQYCGHARTGLAVELSTDPASNLVAAKGTVCVDGHRLGNATRPHSANDRELHTPVVTIESFFEWLVRGHLLVGTELRPRWRIPTRRHPRSTPLFGRPRRQACGNSGPPQDHLHLAEISSCH